jgi:hypothetical protein
MDLQERLSFIGGELDLKYLYAVVDKNFGSKAEDHRLALRRALMAKTGETDPQILSLATLPHLNHLDVSISHCPAAGGYLLTERPWIVGFDIEIASRVELKHIEKLSLAAELEVLTNPAALWAAKESAFKAFSKAHGMTLASDAIVVNASPSKFLMTEFSASPKNMKTMGRGWIFSEGDLKLALFFYRISL